MTLIISYDKILFVTTVHIYIYIYIYSIITGYSSEYLLIKMILFVYFKIYILY